MSSFLNAWLIPRPLMASICSRFGGLTSAAWNALTPEVGPREGFVKLKIHPDLDSRYGYAALNTLGKALQMLEQPSPAHDAVFRLLSFYEFLFASGGPTLDESGGNLRAIGPVLAPSTCQQLVDCWKSINLPSAEKALEQCPLFFDRDQRPYAWFGSAKQLLDYLRGYAGFLEEAVSRDSFYFSFDGNCV